MSIKPLFEWPEVCFPYTDLCQSYWQSDTFYMMTISASIDSSQIKNATDIYQTLKKPTLLWRAIKIDSAHVLHDLKKMEK